ncbi:HNH endonuclease [Ruegeria sp. HKCCA4812]|uniref:HNH endonuclease n=1 Tax=Ruegeria sp. HKCCA4812 TaxID=2682993 RepID=UPI0014899F98
MARHFLGGKFICHWCCERLSHKEVVIDHFEPIALGGSDDPENLVVSCARCNGWKSDRTPQEAEGVINARLEAVK